MTGRKYCKQPDRHVPSSECGHPLPCPWHTVIVDLTQAVPVIDMPDDKNVDKETLKRIKDIADALKD